MRCQGNVLKMLWARGCHKGNMGIRQATVFFSCTFFAQTVFVFVNTQNSFLCGPSFGPFWSVKYLSFGHELPNRTAHHTFLESRHPKVTKSTFPKGTQRKVSTHELLELRDHPSIVRQYNRKIEQATKVR